MSLNHMAIIYFAALYWSHHLGWFIAGWIMVHASWGLMLQQRRHSYAWWAMGLCIIGWFSQQLPTDWASLHLLVTLGLLLPAYPQQSKWCAAWWLVQAGMQQSMLAVAIALACWLLQIDQVRYWRGLILAWSCTATIAITACFVPPLQEQTEMMANSQQQGISRLSERIDGQQPERSQQLLLELRWPSGGNRPLDGCYIRFYPMHLDISPSAGPGIVTVLVGPAFPQAISTVKAARVFYGITLTKMCCPFPMVVPSAHQYH